MHVQEHQESGKITNIVNLGIQELEINNMIKKIFQGTIQVKNDAKCAALAEKTYGSLKNYKDAVFLCLGTGIGGSFFIKGEEIKPSRNSGFEIGHMIIQKDGNSCKCGKKGCFETYCSIKRLKNKLVQVMQLETQIEAKKLLEIVKQRRQETRVEEVLEEYIQNLIIGLSNVIDLLEPQAICLGGSFVYFKEVVYTRLLEVYQEKKYVFNKESLPELKLAILGNDAGIIGATIEK